MGLWRFFLGDEDEDEAPETMPEANDPDWQPEEELPDFMRDALIQIHEKTADWPSTGR